LFMISNCLVVLMAVQEHINKQIHLLNMLSESTQIFMIPIFLSGKIQRDIRGLLMHFMNMGIFHANLGPSKKCLQKEMWKW
jgi:hypothetical protein